MKKLAALIAKPDALFISFFVLSMMVINTADAGNDKFYISSNPSDSWVLFMRERACEDSVCDAFVTLVFEQNAPTPNFCNTMLGASDARELGFHVPMWEYTDYRAYLEVIASFYTDSLYMRLTEPKILTPDEQAATRLRFWEEFGDGILGAFENGIAVVQTVTIDIDGSGQTETIYRLPYLAPETLANGTERKPAPGTSWVPRECASDIPATLFHIGVDPDDVERMGDYGRRLSNKLRVLSPSQIFELDGHLLLFSSGFSGVSASVSSLHRRDQSLDVLFWWEGFIRSVKSREKYAEGSMVDDVPVVVWRPAMVTD